MRFQEKIRNYSKEDIWREYCGFLDMSMEEYMAIQRRLMNEQIQLWSASGLDGGSCGGRLLRPWRNSAGWFR